MKVSVTLELDDFDVQVLTLYAVIFGSYLRDDPTKPWTEAERKKQIRHGIEVMVARHIEEKRKML